MAKKSNSDLALDLIVALRAYQEGTDPWGAEQARINDLIQSAAKHLGTDRSWSQSGRC